MVKDQWRWKGWWGIVSCLGTSEPEPTGSRVVLLTVTWGRYSVMVYRLQTDAGETIVYPKTVVNSAGEEVSFIFFFGGEFLRHRATVKGPPGGDGTGGSPDSPKNAARAKPAPENYVWVASEPLGGLRLGQEIVLNSTSDVQVGEKVAMTLRSGVWVRADLVTLEEATTFAEMRRGLFAGPPAAASDSKHNAQPKAEEGGDSQDHHGDARTLWIDTDEHGERYKRWRDVCKECFTPVFDEKPLEGPSTSLHLIKVTERQGGDPRLWLQGWMRQKKTEPLTSSKSYVIACTLPESMTRWTSLLSFPWRLLLGGSRP